MRPTDVLRDEHQKILHALTVLEAMASALEDGKEVPVEDAKVAADLLRSYADGLHHAKEEDVLFPALIGAGLPRGGGPVAVMLHEHELGRGFIRTMFEALSDWSDASARARWAEGARAFSSLLDQHIAKENGILFRMADQLLSASEDVELLEQFARREAAARPTCGEKTAWEAELSALGTRWT